MQTSIAQCNVPTSAGVEVHSASDPGRGSSSRQRAWMVSVATMTLVLSTVSVGVAQNAYEHFDYAAGPVNGQSGGAGWAGPWVGAGNDVVPLGSTVVCNGQVPSGNALGP